MFSLCVLEYTVNKDIYEVIIVYIIKFVTLDQWSLAQSKCVRHLNHEIEDVSIVNLYKCINHAPSSKMNEIYTQKKLFLNQK